MLISCPECTHQVSDKALSCPLCGFPIASSIKLPPDVEKPVKRANTRSRKYKRLPNGFGSIANLGGKRRKPFAVYPPVIEHNEKGSPIRRPAIGYYETYNDAYAALVLYNQDNTTDRNKLTFAQVFDKWWADKFEDPQSQITYSESTKKNYKWAYGRCDSIYDKPMSEVFADDMQTIIDTLKLSFSSANTLRSLFAEMFRYSYKNGIVKQDYSEFLTIKQKREFEKGVPFTSDELAILWEHKNNQYIRIALILIYTGFRITELKIAEINLEDRYFISGVKTKAGKGRYVPMHSKIVELVADFDQESFKPGTYQDKTMRHALAKCGFEFAANGSRHTPHDCRHTFSWLCDKYKIDEVSKKMLMGHSLGKDVEKMHYTHRTHDELRAEIEKICE